MQGYENYDLQEEDPCIYKDVKRVVWRLRKGDVRLVFYYGEGKIVFLADALAKRQDKLTVGEKIQLEIEVMLQTAQELNRAGWQQFSQPMIKQKIYSSPGELQGTQV